MSDTSDHPPQGDALDAATSQSLLDIVRCYGTPTYAFDIKRLRSQVAKLSHDLPAEVEIFYSLKSNASLGICDVFAECGLGADVSSAGELATATEAGFPPQKIFVAGPFKVSETISQLHDLPEAIISVDSQSELRWLVDQGLRNPLVFRLRPDFGSCAVVPAGSESRFGFTCQQLPSCREFLSALDVAVTGFHVFAGSQVLDADEVNNHLRRSLDLSLRAADTLGITPTLFNLGGGFGIPYGADDTDLDLRRVGDELAKLVDRAAPARLVLELGRYLVAEAGWYLTSVLGHQTFQGRPAVIVDGGVHQRADLCGLGLRTKANPPVALDAPSGPRQPTSVLGCLSLPDDVMTESSLLPELSSGQVLAFGNAGAYGLWSSPAMFHSSPLPAEVAFEDQEIHVMRQRQPAHSILADQCHVVPKGETTHA